MSCGCDQNTLERHAGEHAAMRRAGIQAVRGLGGLGLASLRGDIELSAARRHAHSRGEGWVVIHSTPGAAIPGESIESVDFNGLTVVRRETALAMGVPYHEATGPMNVWQAIPGPTQQQSSVSRHLGWVGLGIVAVGAIAAGVHGYKRSGGSIGSTIGWSFLGAIAPIITVPVALAQGYGKRR